MKYDREQNKKSKFIFKFPPFKRPDNIIINIFNNKIKVFKKVFFFPPPDANLADIDDIIYPDLVKLNKLII